MLHNFLENQEAMRRNRVTDNLRAEHKQKEDSTNITVTAFEETTP